MKPKKKAISAGVLSVCVVLLAVVLSAFSVMTGRRAARYMERQTLILEEQRQCETQVRLLYDTSDYLTEQMNYFVVTHDIDYLCRYWKEVNEDQNREKALEKLSGMYLTDDEISLVRFAKEESERLSGRETWAMRLIADSIGMDEADMPKQVAEVLYSQGEESLSPEQKCQKAQQYIFGKEYVQSKQSIRDSIGEFRQLLESRKRGELNEAVEDARAAQRDLAVFNRLLFFCLLCLGGMFYAFVMRPFSRYESAIAHLDFSGTGRLQPMGSRETVLFAETFNRIYGELIEKERALEEERDRFRMAVENASAIIFEYDFKQDTYSAYGTIEAAEHDSAFELERRIPCFLEKHFEHLVEGEFLDSARSFFSSRRFMAADMRVRLWREGSQFMWVRVTATPILDSRGNPVRLIGKITNIETEKAAEQALEDLQNRDSLTGLYNKDAGTALARAYLEQREPSEHCGIMLLDMDDFDDINHREGSVFADAVLQETAGILKSMTGPDDYQIRLGGDEFMLFVKNCPKSRATVLGPRIADAIQNLSGSGSGALRISVSIGMCVTEVTGDYDELFRCAESTLKYTKEKRRGTAVCYLEASVEMGERLVSLYPGKHEINAINRPVEQRGDLVSYALELLEQAKNMDDAVHLLLIRVGRSLGLSRVSIAEVDRDYRRCRYAYQWADDPVYRLQDSIIYMSSGELDNLLYSYDEDGLCNTYSIKSSIHLGSVLHAAILNCGNYAGFMSFEVMEKEYRWTEQQRHILKELSRVISSFILKARADSVSRAKTDFLSRMSHEIRTPMNAISGMTEIALRELEHPERMRECLNKIRSSNAYLLSLINDILDMSRIESGKIDLNPAPVILCRKLEELGVMIDPQAEEKGIALSVHMDFDKDRQIYMDYLRMNQVLINLLGNAVKFTPSGGEVRLEVKQKEKTDRALTLRFSVKDTGIGIAESARNRIFNAFEQADSATTETFGGTGLGLSISSRLVQMMGGQLEVESEAGHGSEFFFTLTFPLVPKAEEIAEPDEVSMETSYDFKGIRILLVEDNELNQEIAGTILAMHGFVVENAGNGKEAVDLFEQKPVHYFDAILMDIRMPVMDGLEATRRIRTLKKEDSRTVPIIAMTANAFDEDIRKSIESGMNGHLSKPMETEKLLELLRKLLVRPREHS